jgi:hypothetical protein
MLSKASFNYILKIKLKKQSTSKHQLLKLKREALNSDSPSSTRLVLVTRSIVVIGIIHFLKLNLNKFNFNFILKNTATNPS